MRLADGRAIQVPYWVANRLLRADEINFTGKQMYQSFANMLAAMVRDQANIDGKNLVLSGLHITQTADLTCSLTSGIALSMTGTYARTDQAWGFVAGEGEPFVAIVPEDASVGFSALAADGTRYDTVEIRPIETEYLQKSRKFKDPVTGSVTTAIVETQKEYGYELQVRQGAEGGGAVSRTDGWIKIAEVLLTRTGGTTTITTVTGWESSDLWASYDTDQMVEPQRFEVVAPRAVQTSVITTDLSRIPGLIGDIVSPDGATLNESYFSFIDTTNDIDGNTFWTTVTGSPAYTTEAKFGEKAVQGNSGTDVALLTTKSGRQTQALIGWFKPDVTSSAFNFLRWESVQGQIVTQDNSVVGGGSQVPGVLASETEDIVFVATHDGTNTVTLRVYDTTTTPATLLATNTIVTGAPSDMAFTSKVSTAGSPRVAFVWVISTTSYIVEMIYDDTGVFGPAGEIVTGTPAQWDTGVASTNAEWNHIAYISDGTVVVMNSENLARLALSTSSYTTVNTNTPNSGWVPDNPPENRCMMAHPASGRVVVIDMYQNSHILTPGPGPVAILLDASLEPSVYMGAGGIDTPLISGMSFVTQTQNACISEFAGDSFLVAVAWEDNSSDEWLTMFHMGVNGTGTALLIGSSVTVEGPIAAGGVDAISAGYVGTGSAPTKAILTYTQGANTYAQEFDVDVSTRSLSLVGPLYSTGSGSTNTFSGASRNSITGKLYSAVPRTTGTDATFFEFDLSNFPSSLDFTVELAGSGAALKTQNPTVTSQTLPLVLNKWNFFAALVDDTASLLTLIFNGELFTYDFTGTSIPAGQSIEIEFMLSAVGESVVVSLDDLFIRRGALVPQLEALEHYRKDEPWSQNYDKDTDLLITAKPTGGRVVISLGTDGSGNEVFLYYNPTTDQIEVTKSVVTV